MNMVASEKKYGRFALLAAVFLIIVTAVLIFARGCQ